MGILIRNTTKYAPGEIFYYRSKRKVFGCVILFRQQAYYLIALSEEIAKMPKSICSSDVLEAPLFTLAWFSEIDMLSSNRLHRLGAVPISVDYTNRAGLRIDEQGVSITNVGQSATWKHEFRSYALRDALVKDVLSEGRVPGSRGRGSA